MTTEKLHAFAPRLEACGAEYLAEVVRKLIREKLEVEALEDKLTKMGMSDLIKENYGN